MNPRALLSRGKAKSPGMPSTGEGPQGCCFLGMKESRCGDEGFNSVLCLSPVQPVSGRTQGLFGNLPLCLKQCSSFESQLVCVLQSQQCLSFVCLCLSLEQQPVLFLVTGLAVAQAAALLSVAVLGCAGCGFWYLQQRKREREFHRDWMCVWKCYGNKFGLPGLLVTSMLIVASVWIFAGVELLRDKLSSVLKPAFQDSSGSTARAGWTRGEDTFPAWWDCSAASQGLPEVWGCWNRNCDPRDGWAPLPEQQQELQGVTCLAGSRVCAPCGGWKQRFCRWSI